MSIRAHTREKKSPNMMSLGSQRKTRVTTLPTTSVLRGIEKVTDAIYEDILCEQVYEKCKFMVTLGFYSRWGCLRCCIILSCIVSRRTSRCGLRIDTRVCWPHPEPVSGTREAFTQFRLEFRAVVVASVGHNIGDDRNPFMLYPAQDPAVWSGCCSPQFS